MFFSLYLTIINAMLNKLFTKKILLIVVTIFIIVVKMNMKLNKNLKYDLFVQTSIFFRNHVVFPWQQWVSTVDLFI